ncbi:hypothetical protein Tco_0281611 [Tanacetum coccineum]
MTEVTVRREDTIHGISASAKVLFIRELISVIDIRSVMTNKEYHTQMEERFYNVQNKLEAMSAESARKHEELIDLLKKYAISIGRAKEVEEWEKWRDLKRAQEASEDIISNPKSQIFVIEDCDDGSRKEEHLVVPCSDKEIVKFPTQPATTEKSSEDGGNLEELILMSAMDKGDFTRPILAVKEDFGQKLIDDLDEILIVLESYGMINKNEFADAVVAPVATVAHVEQSFLPLGRIKQNQAEHHKLFIWQIILKLGYEICLGHLLTNVRLKQEPVPAQRRTWDPRITQYDVLKTPWRTRCEEKYTPGHRCTSRTLQVMLVDESDEVEEPDLNFKSWDRGSKID